MCMHAKKKTDSKMVVDREKVPICLYDEIAQFYPS